MRDFLFCGTIFQMERIYKENEISEIATLVLQEISTSSFSSAVLVTLSGDLGAGKTSLTQEIARQIGVSENVISPTYIIMKRYEIPSDSLLNKKCDFENFIHIDAYRIEDEEELLNLRWNEILANPKNLVFLEWPEKVKGLTKEPSFSITLTHHNTDSRKVVLLRYTK